MHVVNRIAREFDPALFGVITLAEREGGSYYILDGQHRVAAVVKMGAADTLLPCEVITGKSYKEEAEIFYKRNSRRAVMTSQDKFRGALEAGEDRAPEIVDILESCGFVVNLDSSHRTGSRICGTGALTKVDKEYADGHLKSTLQLIADTWGTDVGPRGTMITGLAMFLSYYREEWNRKRFVSQLSRIPQERIHSEAMDYSKATGISNERSVCAVLVRHYNTRLREENQLPSIEEQRAINRMREEAKRGK